jgi:D-glycero-D-manno-heptose 1,7-bisphosphate phosphatase
VNRAIFLDRDGTLIQEVHRLTNPRHVALIPGAPEAIQDFRRAGYLCLVVTNQSAIGLGLLDEAGLAAVHLEMNEQLARHAAVLDGIYYCPDAPNPELDVLAGDRDRKPGAGMLLRAARDHDLDLSQSWVVGDSLRDLLAGRNAGCRGGVLVRTGHGPRFERELAKENVDTVCDDIRSAAQWILTRDREDPRPPS